MELTEEQYRIYRINFLYYFAHVDHMASILTYGLMPRNRAQNREYITSDISNQEVQARRANRQVFGRSLHDYVPLYFTPKNPMLYAIRNIQDEVVILCFRREILSQGGTVFTDGNSASMPTRFFRDTKDIDQLDWDCIRADRWYGYKDGRRKRCAEVLVPRAVSTYEIRKMVVRNEAARRRAEQEIDLARQMGEITVPEIWLEEDSRWYFDD